MPEAELVPRIGLDDCPDGVVVADEHGRVVAFNAAAERIIGTRADDVVGKDISDALPLEDTEGRRWWVCVDPYGGLATRTGHAERLLQLPDCTEVLVTAKFVRSGRLGPVVRLVVGLRDTHARRREETSRAELVSTVAHELRSPLTSVKGFTATLLKNWGRFTDEQKRLMLETVDADADRVTRLITELLDIARIDSGRLEIRTQYVDIEAAARKHVAGFLARGLDPAGFEIVAPGELPELWADSDKIDQVLANLLENAVRHGGGKVTIVIEPARIGGGAEADARDALAVTVMDEGEGIPEEMQARAFTKFWRSGRRGGTGLGLYIVRGLIEAHGGKVELGRAPSGGALFRFVLPAGAPDFGE